MEAQTRKFRDIAELGKGGMGDVFLTVAPGPAGFHKLLVVKRLRQLLAGDPDFLRMFLNEARLAARLNHPNIVHTYEVGFDGSSHYIAMEYLEGQSLHRLIRRAGPELTLEMQLRVLADALAGLHHAHELADYDGVPLSIVHRDISPANIFVLYDGQVKLVDFGIAKSAHNNETKVGVFKGKIQYVSPEQFTGDPIDRRADIYSAGVVLWEAATQRRMWKDAGDLTVMQRVAGGDVPLPSAVEPQVPKRLEAICMKALAASRDDRYPTAAALQADIEEFLLETNSRVSAREAGAVAANVFADERARLKVLIDDELRLVRDAPNRDPSHHDTPSRGGANAQSLAPTVAYEADADNRETAPEIKLFRALAPPPSRPRRVSLAIGAGLAVTVAGLGVWASSSSSDKGTAAATSNGVPATSVATLTPAASAMASASSQMPAAPSASVEPALPAAPAPSAVHVRITVVTTPKNARVLVDDALLPSDGQLTGFAKDNAVHKVRAEAPGYRTKAQWVRFDSEDINVEISLDRKTKKDALPPSGLGDSSYLLPTPPTPLPAPIPAPSAAREGESAPARKRPAATSPEVVDSSKK